MSYALDSKAAQDAKRSADFNHFVVFDPYNTIACHDFEVRARMAACPAHVSGCGSAAGSALAQHGSLDPRTAHRNHAEVSVYNHDMKGP